MNWIPKAEREKSRKQFGIPTLVTSDKECFILEVRKGVPYDFEIERCDKAEKLIGWLLHLSEKTWFTHEHARQLMEEFEEHFPKEVSRHS